MPKGIAVTIFTCLVLGFLTVQAQTVEEIISNYENAMGGKEKLKSIRSVYMEGVSVMQNGNEINSKMTKVNRELLRTEINFGMGSFSMLLTDKEGWASNPRNGGKFEPIPEQRVKAAQAELDCAGPLVDYAAKGHKAELLGKESVEGKECYKIKLILNTGSDITYFIDPATWYIVRDVRTGGLMGGRMGGGPGGPGQGAQAGQARRGGSGPGGAGGAEVVTDYSDYAKNADGFIFPFSVKRNGMGGNTIYEKIEVNKPVDPKLYKPE
ncbi:hypothetical protein ACFSQD_09530 [Flavihumibacter stibioxidans]|uniref:GLPGLI family protein n=1 Tax=Flavihumibacter stibioxidans TaxID=1834163 RepID=A0ABR7M744_9BACT|nr:hypothetical protein [Flavihumibacter stibioxidans]MBC6490555.1 hypothetical protein [Flavihumibacter stibioxidans]